MVLSVLALLALLIVLTVLTVLVVPCRVPMAAREVVPLTVGGGMPCATCAPRARSAFPIIVLGRYEAVDTFERQLTKV